LFKNNITEMLCSHLQRRITASQWSVNGQSMVSHHTETCTLIVHKQNLKKIRCLALVHVELAISMIHNNYWRQFALMYSTH